MQSLSESGVSGKGREWIATCEKDGWRGEYGTFRSARVAFTAHKQGKRHRENGGLTYAENGDLVPSTIVESGPMESVVPSFTEALKALADARKAYEDSLNAFLRLIGD